MVVADRIGFNDVFELIEHLCRLTRLREVDQPFKIDSPSIRFAFPNLRENSSIAFVEPLTWFGRVAQVFELLIPST
jgi:hypothetical protein